MKIVHVVRSKNMNSMLCYSVHKQVLRKHQWYWSLSWNH